MTPAADRFRKLYRIDEETGCWPWIGATSSCGYGRFRVVHRKCITATHFALELDGRPRPSGDTCALHSCDNPPCVNPAHLRWGSRKENSAEMLSKGRSRGQQLTHCRNGHPFDGQEKYPSETWRRRCRICHQASMAKLTLRRRAKRELARREAELTKSTNANEGGEGK